MIFHSCQNRLQKWKHHILFVGKQNHPCCQKKSKRYFSMYEKSKKHHERCWFILFWLTSTQTHLKQTAEIKTPDPNCGKIAALIIIIASMLPEIIHKVRFNVWKIKETSWNVLFSFILMIFHSSTLKTGYRNENTRSRLWGNSCFDFYNIIHLATNSSQDTFQCMENQGNTMKYIVF